MLDLANDIFLYEQSRSAAASSSSSSSSSSDLLQKIMEKVTADDMSSLYQNIVDKFAIPVDEELMNKMKTKNAEELAAIDAKIEDAATNAGDTEVIEGLLSKARYYTKIGNWSEATSVYDDILGRPKTVTGKKIDANMEKARIYLFTLDQSKLKSSIDEAKRLNEIGGDWDRRNRLKVYEAHACLAAHDLKGAAKLLLDCVATFTCTELCTYTQFMFYTVITNIIALDRNDLRKKIVNDPHVLTEIRSLPNAKSLVNGIYQCDYKGFFESMINVLPEITANRFLQPLANYIVREYRVLAYSQFLEAYKSVMMSSMASSFGISVNLLDAELSRFIASGRLNAKIDKVGDIVETRRPDKKNAQYQDVIKKGDALLNQIQKLVRAIDM